MCKNNCLFIDAQGNDVRLQTQTQVYMQRKRCNREWYSFHNYWVYTKSIL